MALINELRAKFAQDQFEFSKHAVDQTILRDIAVQEIREAMDRLQKTEIAMNEKQNEKLVYRRVTYTLYKNGKFYIIENVPARINEETGEQFFAPETVEKLRKIILGDKKPLRTMQTPVFDFA